MLIVGADRSVIVNMTQVTSIVLNNETKIQFYLATISEDNAVFNFESKEKRDRALALILAAYDQGSRVLYL